MKNIICFRNKSLFLGAFCTMLGVSLFSLSARANSLTGLPRRLSEGLYTADPSAHVFNGKIYIYPSHDIPHEDMGSDDGNEYQMEDYHVFSMDDPAGLCTDHGEVLNVKDVPWASRQMWAPDAAYKDGTYYLYFPAKDHDGIFRIGVATASDPAGPFTPEPSYIPDSFSIDPCVFQDEDGASYIYFGGLWGGQLEKWLSGAYDRQGETPKGYVPAMGPMFAKLGDDMKTFEAKPKRILILDENGKSIKAWDEDRWYFEAPWIHKFGGKYYLSYSTGTTHRIVYAESDTPDGPFTYKGVILEPVNGWTTHHSIIEFNGKWYLFYHDSSLSGGVSYLRCVWVRELEIAPDGTITTIIP